MSLSATLANALTGLTAASRGAELVSSNVANAMNEHYTRRELELSTRFTGGLGAGVKIDGVARVVDEVLIRDRRLAAADLAQSQTSIDFHESVLGFLGLPGEAGSLTDLQANFEASLIAAASSPNSESRLAGVLTTATDLAAKLNEIGEGIQTLREDTDQTIARDVERLNTSLVQIADLNERILRLRATDALATDLLDQRQALIDDISDLVPLRQLQRENGTVALYSMGGALLLDVTPAEFGFSATEPITADMTVQSGGLSGLTINGQPVGTGIDASPISGGRLAGLFNARDVLAVKTMQGVDEVARDLIARFEAPGPDPSLGPGDPGLFTDDGAALDTLLVDGLSARVAINAAVDPDRGGNLWRLRSGLGAASPGPVGDNAILTAFRDVLQESRAPSSPILGSAGGSSADFVARLTSDVGQSVRSGDIRKTFSAARFDSLRNEELALGVDTDQEMQKLLLIEQTYAANARVIQVVDDLIQTLIGL